MTTSREELRKQILNEMNAGRIDHKTYIDSEWLLSEYDKTHHQELQKAREEAVSKERARIEIELMSTESHSHPGEPGLFKAWYDIRKVINKNI